ncbi:class I SAM-dependent methyltransferase [Candidatus Poribacteria bacterium]|nr:class I SAM-dependent methyltransferase [Candidatus Poribacteria bacterium]
MHIDYNQIASEYAQHRRINPEALKSLISTGEISGKSRVLEVGCGTGNYIVALEEATGCECWGIDLSEQMLAIAATRSERIDFRLGSAERIDSPADFFDLAYSVSVVHHVRNRLAHFQEIYRALKSGGKACTITGSEWMIRNRQPLAVYFPETVEVDLDRYPVIGMLRQEMEQARFRSISEQIVEYRRQLDDIQAYRDKAFSALHLISAEAFSRGIERMEQALQKGPIPFVSRYLLLWGMK